MTIAFTILFIVVFIMHLNMITIHNNAFMRYCITINYSALSNSNSQKRCSL